MNMNDMERYMNTQLHYKIVISICIIGIIVMLGIIISVYIGVG